MKIELTRKVLTSEIIQSICLKFQTQISEDLKAHLKVFMGSKITHELIVIKIQEYANARLKAIMPNTNMTLIAFTCKKNPANFHLTTGESAEDGCMRLEFPSLPDHPIYDNES
jgi:hypothetical protein